MNKKRDHDLDSDEEFELLQAQQSNRVYQPDFVDQMRWEALGVECDIHGPEDLEIAKRLAALGHDPCRRSEEEEDIADILRRAGLTPTLTNMDPSMPRKADPFCAQCSQYERRKELRAA